MDIQVLVVDGDSVELEEAYVVLLDGAWSEPENEAEMRSEADSLGGLPELDHVLDSMSNCHNALSIHERALADKKFDDGRVALVPEVEAIAIAGEGSQSWDGAEAITVRTVLLHHLKHTENIGADFDHLIRFRVKK